MVEKDGRRKRDTEEEEEREPKKIGRRGVKAKGEKSGIWIRTWRTGAPLPSELAQGPATEYACFV